MGQDRVGISMARLERALARIEAAGDRPAAPAPGDSAASDELREAHRLLRGQVEGALTEIDALLATGREQG